MHLLCPHCRSPVERDTLSLAEEIVCPSCGSTFRMEQESTAAWSPRQGRRKLGRFELIEAVGIGAFGTVYKARDPQLDRIVAIKVPRAGNLSGDEELDRFLREARSVARLRHPGIVPLHEVGEHDVLPYLVSDFIQGLTLTDLLSARHPSPREAAELVAEAVQYAHEQGVVHRDIKPSNILLDEEGRPYLMDFGLAKRDAGEVTMTLDGQVLGTPAYMSPEQARGEGHRVDGRSDVYSLGVVLYLLLTGELPFRGTTRMLLHQVLHDEPKPPRKLNDRIPRDVDTICLKCLEKDPRRRFASAAALSEDLRRSLAGEPITARRTSALERAVKWARRRPAITGLLGLVALVGAAGLTGVLWQWREAIGARKVADQQRIEAQRRATRVALDRGLALCQQGEVGPGMLWLARALELAPPGEADLIRVARTNLASWWHRLAPLKEVLSHGGEVADLSPDGTLLLSGGASPDGKAGDARLWDVATLQPIGPPIRHWDPVRAAFFCPGGRRFISAAGTEVRIWDTATRTPVGDPIPTPSHHVPVAGPDGKMLASPPMTSGSSSSMTWGPGDRSGGR